MAPYSLVIFLETQPIQGATLNRLSTQARAKSATSSPAADGCKVRHGLMGFPVGQTEASSTARINQTAAKEAEKYVNL